MFYEASTILDCVGMRPGCVGVALCCASVPRTWTANGSAAVESMAAASSDESSHVLATSAASLKSSSVAAAGLAVATLENSAQPGECGVLLIHGNLSSKECMREMLVELESRAQFAVAIDLRGFGATTAADGSEPPGIVAATGLEDWAAECQAAADSISSSKGGVVKRWVWLGWSMGGGVVMARLASNTPNTSIAGAVLVSTLSPSGYGGSKSSKHWALAFEDGAGGGAGLVNPDFVASIRDRDTSEGAINAKGVVKALYVSASGLAKLSAERIDEIVASVLTTRTGDDFWPGAAAASSNWPGTKPGATGVNNAIAALHTKFLWSIADLPASERVPISWVRGDSDFIVHNAVPPDIGKGGVAGLSAGYPGEDVCPVLHMLDETRELLVNKYGAGECGRARDRVREVILKGVGHGPVIEAADKVADEIMAVMR